MKNKQILIETNSQSSQLILVTSHPQAKTIMAILGNKYHVLALPGPLRDLPAQKMGLDMNDGYLPKYELVAEHREFIKALKAFAKKMSHIYLAFHPDREGELYAWHLSHILKRGNKAQLLRVMFNEITFEALHQALANPCEINIELANAQQAKKALDRLIGYKLTPLLQNKFSQKLSLGRLQSVVLKSICEQYAEVMNFKAKDNWKINAVFKKNKIRFKSHLINVNDQPIIFKSRDECQQSLKTLKTGTYHILDCQTSQQSLEPPEPFTTSTLQQEASHQLGFSIKYTMHLAQCLYEGTLINDELTSLITYFHTDSRSISNNSQKQAQMYIKQTYGQEYVSHQSSDKAFCYEAIRPSHIALIPERLKTILETDLYKLYHLIWNRFIASQMTASINYIKTVNILANKHYHFTTQTATLLFPGFQVVYPISNLQENIDDAPLPELSQGDLVSLTRLEMDNYPISPPKYFTEISLIQKLSKNGPGLSHSYSNIITSLMNKEYITKHNQELIPTDLGLTLNKQMIEYFPKVIDINFSTQFENNLMAISKGQLDWKQLLQDNGTSFLKALEFADRNMKKISYHSKELCSECQQPMEIKSSRYGKFLACTGYPQCTNKKSLLNKINMACPQDYCDGEIISRRSKTGKTFYGCSNFPGCQYASWHEPTNTRCSECGSFLLKKTSKSDHLYLQCSNDDCKKTASIKDQLEMANRS